MVLLLSLLISLVLIQWAFSEFYCNASTGANINGGDDAGSPSMTDTTGACGYVQSTRILTTSVTSGSVAVGQFISIYLTTATVPITTARITNVTGGGLGVWVITLSATAYSGTAPGSLANGSTYKVAVGGAWKGPNAAESHPFGFITNVLKNAAGDIPRINFKNNTTYSAIGAILHNKNGPFVFQGYATTVGDGGKAIIDGGTSGASYDLLTNSGQVCQFWDFIIQNNGATGAANGFTISGITNVMNRVVVHDVRGNGFIDSSNGNANIYIECEAYLCNTDATGIKAGFNSGSNARVFYKRCISHDNGTNTDGFNCSGTSYLEDCIADTNGSRGCLTGYTTLSGCTFYNNTGEGVRCASANLLLLIDNCVFSGNGSGILVNNATTIAVINNCAFFSTGTQISGSNIATGTITLTGDPFTAPTTGNFTLNNTAGAGAACRATGRGVFTQTQASYTGSVSYPDVSACQVSSIPVSSGGGGSVFGSGVILPVGGQV